MGVRDAHLRAVGEGGRKLADLSVLRDRPRMAECDGLMDAATRILDVHRADPDDDSCTGCRAQWDRWIWFADCAQRDWARSVVETHGAVADLSGSLLPDTERVP